MKITKLSVEQRVMDGGKTYDKYEVEFEIGGASFFIKGGTYSMSREETIRSARREISKWLDKKLWENYEESKKIENLM
jgi:hypothetical protein